MRLTPALFASSLGLASALGASGCSDSRAGASRVNPTYIEVDPAEFIDPDKCATSAGGLRWYVATLIDVTPDKEKQPSNFRLPSSPPTPCSRSVFFSGVVAGGRSLGTYHEAHEYVAELEGYDAESLKPLHEGSSVMTVAGETVIPGWVGACGGRSSGLAPLLGLDAGETPSPDAGPLAQLEGPLRPSAGRTVTFRGCELSPLGEQRGTGSVRVGLAAALAGLACGNGPGEVARFEVTLGDAVESAECGGSVTFADLEPGAFLEFEVVATGAVMLDGGTDAGAFAPRWTTTCYQEPVANQELTARCDPLVRD